MNNIFRLSLVGAALTVAAVSQAQALKLTYIGSSYLVPQTNGFTTTSLGYLGDDFNFGAAKTVATNSSTGTITLYNTLTALQNSGPNYVLLNYTLDTAAGTTVTATATATGFGTYAGLTGTGVRVARNNVNTYGIDIQGTLNPVPEPASMAALGLGAVAMIRRRRSAK